jgi:uncharacterized RDD family membrane protein YckC
MSDFAIRSRDVRGLEEPGEPAKSSKAFPAVRTSFSRRLVAYCIDLLILSVAEGSLRLVGQLSTGSTVFSVVLLLLAVAVPLLYFVMAYAASGQTVGKKVVGIRVVSLDGRPLDWRTGVVRTLGYVPSMFILYLGFLWALWDSEKQAWQDKLAGTIVVPASIVNSDFLGYLEPAVNLSRRRRWAVRLGIPSVLLVALLGIFYGLWQASGMAELQAFEVWPDPGVSAVEMVDLDLSELGLELWGLHDATTFSDPSGVAFVDGSVAFFEMNDLDMVHVAGLVYDEPGTAGERFEQLADSKSIHCGRFASFSLGERGAYRCYSSGYEFRSFWRGHTILDVEVGVDETSGLDATALADQILVVIATQWQSLSPAD